MTLIEKIENAKNISNKRKAELIKLLKDSEEIPLIIKDKKITWKGKK